MCYCASAGVKHAGVLLCSTVKLTLPSLSLTLSFLARRHELSMRGMQRRWQHYCAAEERGDADPLSTAATDHRGGHNRAFTLEQEKILAEAVLAAPTAMTQPQIQQTALQLHRDVVVAHRSCPRVSRLRKPFTASPAFVSTFKRRHRLSSHRMSARFVSQAVIDPRETEDRILSFVNDTREAITALGARYVLNMDETPVPKCEHPTTGVVRTGSGRAASCTTDAGNRLNVTHFPCISAAGDKLQMCAVLKGKTPRTLKKITEGASADVKKVRLYFSQSGWINAGIIIRWLSEVVAPSTAGHAAALLLDDYHAHWTDEVRAAAAAMHLQLIPVPPRLTSEYQPLDVQFNGPMTKARQRLWMQQRLAHPDSKDSFQNAIERAQQA
jgi:hypothetical protein